jgi:hypothetical protein
MLAKESGPCTMQPRPNLLGKKKNPTRTGHNKPSKNIIISYIYIINSFLDFLFFGNRILVFLLEYKPRDKRQKLT